MDSINENWLTENFKSKARKEFKEARPYPHLVINNFFKPGVAESLFSNFPSVDELKIHWKGLNENKFEGSDFSSFDPVFEKVRKQISSPSFYQWISEITGIEDVFVTDDSLGTGLHQGANGSFLDIHIDFNIHHIKNVHRRLNMLVYLQKDWKEEYGGHLEMWDAKMKNCEKMVLPTFNQCVVFETSEISYHGYSKINVPEGITRKSFFAYFYTKEREGASSYHDTVFKARPTEGKVKKVKTTIKESIKNKVKSALKKLNINF